MMKVLIIDRFPEDFIQALSQLPVEVDYQPESDRPLVLEKIEDQHILILNSKVRVDRELVDKAQALQLVVRAGVGMDHIDEAYLKEKGIQARNTKGANATAVGEQTVGMLLAIQQHLLRADHQVRQFQWLREPNRGRELKGRTVGLIGYGHTGQAVARCLSGFRCRVLAYDKYREGYGELFAKQASMEEIFQQAEILSLHVPLTDETSHMVDAAFLQQFRNPIILLNLARGPVVHLPSLLEALETGKVVAAGLDVLPNEKMHLLSEEETTQYQRLFAHEQVLLTPHIGGWTVESRQAINQRIIQFVEEALGKG